MSEETTKQCPFCAETIQAAAVVCRFCNRDLPAVHDVPVGHAAILPGASAALWKCSACGGAVRRDATQCKHCKKPLALSSTAAAPAPAKPMARLDRVAIVAGIVILIVVGAGVALNAIFPSRGTPTSSGVSGTDAFVMCEQFVTDRLKSPATAKFPSSVADGVNIALVGSEQYRVRAFVDSQNGFGAMIRTSYTCTVQHAEGVNWRLIDLATEGA